jgi:4,5-dihydroxyphthalate decarboxylase
LVAGFAGNAGVGRSGAPTDGGWQVIEADYPNLFSDSATVEKDYFARTGIYPIHGMIVVKEAVLAKHPWITKSLYDAFAKANSGWLKYFSSGAANSKLDEKYRKRSKIVGPDPLPYGQAQNMPCIEALARAAENQKMTPRLMQVSDLFVDPEKV